MSQLLRTKDIDQLIAAAEAPEKRLRKTLGPWSLTALGVGAVIGSGIFILTGTAAAGEVLQRHSILHAPLLDLLLHGRNAVSTIGRPGAGPAISLSFLLTALACSFAALCYAEMASMIPIAGSAYTYAYATLGEIFAWIIGWDLILEYAVSNMAVAVGFSAYMNDLLESLFGVHLPAKLCNPMIVGGEFTGNWFNVPALAVLLILTWILVRGVRESAKTNNLMVLIKVAAILIFVIGAARAVRTENWHPFMPNGFPGVLTGAAIVFFTYIGFDSVSTHAEEARNPRRDVPIGIIASLLICTVLYCAVSAILTGMVPSSELETRAPVAAAFRQVGLSWARYIISAGALAGITSVLLVLMLSQPRVLLAMARDRLLPPGFFGAVHPRFRTPWKSTMLTGFVVCLMAGLLPLRFLMELVNIGTLLAFVIVCAAVLIMRVKHPEAERPFKAPFYPVVPILGILSCLLLMFSLTVANWWRLFVWLGIGFVIYFGYGRRHSVMAKVRAAAGR